jgi:Flp pilus assembly pilin Flp
MDITMLRTYLAARIGVTSEEGQTLVEYALILALVSIGTIAALLALTGKINDVFNQIVTAL